MLGGWEVTAGLMKVMVPTAEFVALVTFGLTAEDQDQLQNPTFISSMGLPTVSFIVLCCS